DRTGLETLGNRHRLRSCGAAGSSRMDATNKTYGLMLLNSVLPDVFLEFRIRAIQEAVMAASHPRHLSVGCSCTRRWSRRRTTANGASRRLTALANDLDETILARGFTLSPLDFGEVRANWNQVASDEATAASVQSFRSLR